MGSRNPPHVPPVIADDDARCDACGDRLAPADADDSAYAISGAGVYVWTRGEEVRFEKAPLCPGCAVAVGVSALARWELEEEEG